MILTGINGFGRIGRLLLRHVILNSEIKVVAVNDPFLTTEQMAYLYTHDSVHGGVPYEVTYDADSITVKGIKIAVLREKTVSAIKWNDHGAQIILECTGVFTLKESAGDHLGGSVKFVIISAPSKDAPMFVVGVNDDKFDPAQHSVLSNASCTTNCLAPLAKVLNDKYGIVEGLMTTVHATTATQRTVDAPVPKNWRLGRSCQNNIIPTSTGAAVAVGKVLPELQGKLTGMAMRVPVNDVSVVDLTVRLERAATYEEVIATLEEAASSGPMKGILKVTHEPVVSSDFIGNFSSSTVDATAGIALNSNFMKFISWYDNEQGYSCRLMELAIIVGKKGCM